MDKIKDTIRFVVVSPEVLSGLLVSLVAYYWPEAIVFFAKFAASTEPATITIIIGAPLAMIVGAYKLGFDVLNPAEHKNALKEWPRYWMVRNRVIFSWILGTIGLFATVAAYFLANSGMQFVGTVVIAVCWVVVAASLASIAFARMSIQDVLHNTGIN